MPGGVTKELATSQVMDTYGQWGYQFLFKVPGLQKDVSSTVNQLVENKVTYNWGHILQLLARGILNDIHGKPIQWSPLKINAKSMICSEQASYVLQQAGVEPLLDPRLQASTPEAFVNKKTGATPIGTYKYGKASSIPLPTPSDSTDYSPETLQKMGEISFKELKDLMKNYNLPAVFLCDWAQNKYPVDALIHAVTKSWANHVAILYHSEDGNFYLTQSEMENTAQQVAAIKDIFKQLPGRLAALAKEYNVSDELNKKGAFSAIKRFVEKIEHAGLGQDELLACAKQGLSQVQAKAETIHPDYVVIDMPSDSKDDLPNTKATQTDAEAEHATKETQTDLGNTQAVIPSVLVVQAPPASHSSVRKVVICAAVASAGLITTKFMYDALSLEQDASMIFLGEFLIAAICAVGCYLTRDSDSRDAAALEDEKDEKVVALSGGQ